jgi:hypothetical protein
MGPGPWSLWLSYLRMKQPGASSAVLKCFFATLDCELLDRRKCQAKADARMAIYEVIEGR